MSLTKLSSLFRVTSIVMARWQLKKKMHVHILIINLSHNISINMNQFSET